MRLYAGIHTSAMATGKDAIDLLAKMIMLGFGVAVIGAVFRESRPGIWPRKVNVFPWAPRYV